MQERKKTFLVLFTFCFNTVFAQTEYFPAGLDSSYFNTWLDATDLSNLVITNGKVSSWKDKGGKGMNATNSTSSKQPILSSLFGKNFVEFRPLPAPTIDQGEVLVINEKLDYLDPPNGSFLMQSVYIYPDIAASLDFRVSTYSRESHKEFGYRFATKDTKTFLGIIENTNPDPMGFCGYDDSQMKDLKGSISIIENNSYYTNGFTGGQLNVDGLSGINFNYAGGYNDIVQNAGIGNRPSFVKSVHWAIGEHIFLNKTASESEKVLLRTYMTMRWSDLVQIAPLTREIVNKIPLTHQRFFIGIYKASQFDSIATVKSNNGLVISSSRLEIGAMLPNEKNVFLKDNGDFIFAAEDGSELTNANIGNFSRLNKTWFIVKNDSAKNGGVIKFTFNANKLNLKTQLSNNSFYILFNQQSNNFSVGKNKIIPIQQSLIADGLVQFVFDSRYVENGYYTIMFGDPSIIVGTGTIPNFEIFSLPTFVSLTSPLLEQPTNFGKYVNLSWNTKKLNYQPIGFNIYRSIGNSNNYTLLTTVFNKNTFTVLDVALNVSYSFKIKALDLGFIESEFSNEETILTNDYLPEWRFIPQYSGVGSVTMSGEKPIETEEFEFQFESNNQQSQWQDNSYFKESNLINGIDYLYRFRHRIKNNTNTISNWSTSKVTRTSLDSLQGGFTYQWTRFNTSDTSLYGLGYHKVFYDTTGLRYIKHAPPFGQHPRIYCNPDDKLSIRSRLLNTESGNAVLKQIRATTKLIVTNSTLTTTENSDGLGGLIVSNIGALQNYSIYTSFINNDIIKLQAYFNNKSYNFLHQLAIEAFECWLFYNDTSSLPITYSSRATNCATAIYNWSQRVLANELTPPDTDALLYFSLAYDFSYPFMNDTQRNSVRNVIAMNTLDVKHLRYGFSYAFTQTSNWATFGFEVIPNLAIEGEEGYKQETTDVWARTAHNFLNYGIYENGAPIEGLGKNQVNAVLLIALAKRGYSMLGIPNLQKYGTNYLPALIQPFGFSFYVLDLLGGTGKDVIYGGQKFNSVDLVGLKWVLSKDLKIDYAWKNFIGRSNSHLKQGYAYSTAVVMPRNYFAPNIPAAIFCSNYFLPDNHVFNSFDYLDGLGGLAILKNSLDTLGSQVYFHSRQDFGGHTSANRGSFSYSSLGRIWIPLINTKANTDATYADSTQYHSSILVDSLGGISKAFPTKIIQFESMGAISKVANDMKEYYGNDLIRFVKTGKSISTIKTKNPQLATEPLTESSNDFRFEKSSYTHFDLSNQGYPHENYDSLFNYYYKNRIRNVEKAYRTLSMIKSGNPYLLVVDDFKMDSTAHHYRWITQLANDITIDETIINLNNSNYRYDIILKEPATSGNRKLLIRILQNEGITNPLKPGIITVNNYFKVPRLQVDSKSIEPKIKIMIYAFTPTMPLPITNWNEQKDKLEIIWPDRIQNIEFPMDNVGKTDIILKKETIKNQIAIPIIPVR
jgi:hypothetical protein